MIDLPGQTDRPDGVLRSVKRVNAAISLRFAPLRFLPHK